MSDMCSTIRTPELSNAFGQTLAEAEKEIEKINVQKREYMQVLESWKHILHDFDFRGYCWHRGGKRL